MRKILKYFLLILISFCAGLAGAITFYRVYAEQKLAYDQLRMPVYKASNALMPNPLTSTPAGSADFVHASEVATPCVVYIKVESMGQQQQQNPFFDPFFDFFGNIGPVSSSGSGVIISSDGYIVTNAHVVDKAEKIEVVMNNNKRSFQARVIGVDGSSDLALLKIEGNNLPFINFANSDDLAIGEWVAAVGNPFNLTSTVTAGIVSARGRNINIVHDRFPIESFIQTDAAINPGNSGGALVNLEGKLVGINSAILSKTGSYSGYGFAIPSNIVKKVISDLKEYGKVQRGFIEAEVTDIDEKVADKLTGDINGVYVNGVVEDGNADKAGIKEGDLILKVDNKMTDSRSVFDEQLAYHRPGDKVPMVVQRGKNIFETTVTLSSTQGTTSFDNNRATHSQSLNADFEAVTKIEKEKYGIKSGYRVFNIGSGPMSRYNLPDGFIITSLNGKEYNDVNDLIADLGNASGKIQLQGINPDGSRGMYSFYLF